MTVNLQQNAIDMINSSGLKASTIATIFSSSATSPYFAGLWNAAADKGVTLVAGSTTGGTNFSSSPSLIIAYNPTWQDIEAPLRYMTVLAHELGHATLLNGSSYNSNMWADVYKIAYSPQEAATFGGNYEGVALSAEYIVAKQLGLNSSSTGYMHSDELNGAITKQLDLLGVNVSNFTFGALDALAFSDINSSGTKFLAQYNLNTMHPGSAPQLTYREYYSDWYILANCLNFDGKLISPLSIPLEHLPNGDLNYKLNSNGSCSYTFIDYQLPDGNLANIYGSFSASGVLSSASTVTSNSDGTNTIRSMTTQAASDGVIEVVVTYNPNGSNKKWTVEKVNSELLAADAQTAANDFIAGLDQNMQEQIMKVALQPLTFTTDGLNFAPDLIDFIGDTPELKYNIDFKTIPAGINPLTGIYEDEHKEFYYEAKDSHDNLVRINSDGSYGVKSGSVGITKHSDGTVDVKVDGALIQPSEVGSIFGSTIGKAIAGNNQFNQIIASSFFETLGASIADTLAIATTESSLAHATDIAFSDFAKDFSSNLANAGIGAVSAVIMSELTDALGLASGDAEFVNTVGGAYMSQLIASGFSNLGNVSFQGVNIGFVIDSYIGQKIGKEIYTVQTEYGGYGSAIGTAVGAAVGEKVGAKIGTSIWPGVGTVIGAVIGYVVGGFFGDWINGDPKSQAEVVLDPITGRYKLGENGSANGAKKDTAVGLSNNAIGILNGFLDAIDGDAYVDGKFQPSTFGTFKKKLSFRYFSADGKKHQFDFSSSNADALFNYGLVHELQNIKIADGDVYLKRALHSALSKFTLTDDESSAPANATDSISGGLQIAADYEMYLDHQDEIDALMNASPDSAFTAGWIVTLQRAREMGLMNRQESDHYGGWQHLVESREIDGATGQFTAGQLTPKYERVDFRFENNERLIDITRADGSAITEHDYIKPESKKEIKFTTQAELNTALSKVYSSAVITGTDGNDVINAGNLGNDVFGGAGNDKITGGDMADWIFGGAGNDTLDAGGGNNNLLNGEAGNDVLIGGAGSDWLIGGEGNDLISGGTGDNILDGGIGSDTLTGGAGTDTFIFRRGDGADTLYDNGIGLAVPRMLLGVTIPPRSSSVNDVIEFGSGISLADISVKIDDTNKSAVITILDSQGLPTSDSIRIMNWSNINKRIEILRFANGSQSSSNLGSTTSFAAVAERFGDFSTPHFNKPDTGDIGLGSQSSNGDVYLIDLFPSDASTGSFASSYTPIAPPVTAIPRDPLVLDLDGNGAIDTLSMSANVHFDHDNSGFAEQTSWIAPTDGFLVRDINNNGVIENGGELFGSYTKLANGNYAKNGYEALAQYDLNGDSEINSSDAVFTELKVWQDLDSNGVVNAGELKSLNDLNITSIKVSYSEKNTFDTQHVLHEGESSFSYLNGHEGISNTLWFETDARMTIPVETNGQGVNVSESIEALPDAVGFGNMHSLHDAMALDSSGVLQQKVEAFVNETDANAKRAMVEDILSTWSGHNSVDVNSRGNSVNAKHLSILESFWGQAAVQQNPTGQYAQSLEVSYQQLEQSVYTQLMVNDGSFNLFNKIYFQKIDGVLTADFTRVGGYFADLFAHNDSTAEAQFKELLDVVKGINPYDTNFIKQDLVNTLMGDTRLSNDNMQTMMKWIFSENDHLVGLNDDDQLYGYAGNDTIDGGAGDDELNGGLGNDMLRGGNGDDYLSGDEGDDSITGDDGNDVLVGGAGNDTLNGGQGDDDYIWGRGDGSDIIIDLNGVNHLFLKEGIVASDIKWSRSENVSMSSDALVATIKDTGETLSILNWFNNSYSPLDTIELADGTVLDKTQIELDTHFLLGTQNADILSGGKIDEEIAGFDGDDSLYGYGGDDSLSGGEGNDRLDGGDGNDTLSGDGGNDTLLGNYGNDVISGGAGADSIDAGDGNDDLYGGSGDDTLIGGAGDDTYRWGRGDGNDFIDEAYYYDRRADRNDKLILTGGLVASDIAWSRADIYLIGTIKDTGETITIRDWFTGTNYKLNQISLEDGTVLDISAIELETQIIKGDDGANYLTGTSLNDTIMGYGGNDTLYGFSGNDSLSGGEGNDRLDGGDGNDTLSGDGGNDTLLGNYGNDVISGGAGADSIDAGDGNDDLYGGAGDDTLIGGAGDDTYRWGRGDGNDFVDETYYYDRRADRNDKLILTGGLVASDIAWSRSNTYLIGTIKDTGETITIREWFNGTNYKLNQILLEDGTVLDISAIELETQIIKGDDGANYLTGTSLNDTIMGYGGNDTLYGFSGNDSLSGGEGNDRLDGGDGNDTLSGDGGNDTLLGNYGNDVISGGAGADSIDAGDGNDDLYGGAGDDTLIGGAGDDTYRWGRGDGNDFVDETYYYDRRADRNDKLILTGGLVASDIAWSRSNTYLIGTIKDTGETITIREWFTGTNYKLNQILLEDGTVLDISAIELETQIIKGDDGANYLTGTSLNDTIMGYGGDDSLYGYGGDDSLSGGEGNDRLDGGDGNDTLSGDGGNDTLLGNYGNDVISAGAGADSIDAGDGNDDLYGGAGDDTLIGGAGDDTYRWGRGDGNDFVDETYYYDRRADRNDKLILTGGLVASDIAWSRSNTYLIGTIKDTGETITIRDWFTNAAYKLNQISLEDGTVLDISAIELDSQTIKGDGGANYLAGTSSNDTIMGYGGNDTITDSNGSDVIDGGTGDDVINDQGSGTNLLRGGDGNDSITFSYMSSNTIEGGSGDDVIRAEYIYYSNLSNINIFDGGAGNDTIQSGGSTDTYLYKRGDGQDTISDYGYTYWGTAGTDQIIFDAGITRGDLTVTRSDYNLIIKINDPVDASANDQITIENWYSSSVYQIEVLQFADTTNMTAAELSVLGNTIYGTGLPETINGTSDDNTLYGFAGDDILNGAAGNDTLMGGSGSDTLNGGSGDDVLNGGEGSDVLNGGDGNDLYQFGRNGGVDTITENDATSGNADVIQFGSNISVEQLWFQHVGNNLETTIVGTTDKLILNNWYLGSNYQVEQLKTANGKVLLNTQVEALVSAMAAFSPPVGEGAIVSQEVHDQLQPVLAANWN